MPHLGDLQPGPKRKRDVASNSSAEVATSLLAVPELPVETIKPCEPIVTGNSQGCSYPTISPGSVAVNMPGVFSFKDQDADQ